MTNLCQKVGGKMGDLSHITSVIVAFDFSRGSDVDVAIVGKRDNGRTLIINEFQGEEARELYRRLTSRK